MCCAVLEVDSVRKRGLLLEAVQVLAGDAERACPAGRARGSCGRTVVASGRGDGVDVGATVVLHGIE